MLNVVLMNQVLIGNPTWIGHMRLKRICVKIHQDEIISSTKMSMVDQAFKRHLPQSRNVNHKVLKEK